VVEAGTGFVGDRDGDVLLVGAVAGGVIGDAVLPAAPQDATPGASEGADRAWVVVAAGFGVGVAILGPGMPMAGAVGERAERRTQAMVTATAKGGDLALA
jgi:hypothetical protein